MYKIILVCCLVLAVAEGFITVHPEDNVNLEQQRYSKILQNYQKTLSYYLDDFFKNYEKLNKELVSFPYTYLPQNGGCLIDFEDPKDLREHCFSPNVPNCKSTMRSCLNEASKQVMELWRSGVRTKDDLKNFVESFEKNIANCRQTFDISTSNYHECVADVISLANAYVSEHQKLFIDQMENAENISKEFIKELEYSVSVFKSRQSML